MTREAGVVRDKTKALEHLSDQHSRGLLPVHANSQSLGPAQKQERVERRQSVSYSVDGERELLWKG